MTIVLDCFLTVPGDIGYLCSNTRNDMSQTELNKRIHSIVLRVLGTVCALIALYSGISFLSAFSIEPMTAVFSLIKAIFFGILAHECIVVGTNQRKIVQACSTNQFNGRDLWGCISQAGQSIANVARAGFYELTNNTPYVYQGTLICAPVYRFFNNKGQS